MYIAIVSAYKSNIYVETKLLQTIFDIYILCVEEIRKMSSASEYNILFPQVIVCHFLFFLSFFCDTFGEGNRVAQTVREIEQ